MTKSLHSDAPHSPIRGRRIRYLQHGTEVDLRREPNNPHDSNAVAIYVGEKVGHIPRSDAEIVARAMDAGYGVVAHIEHSAPLLTIMWDETPLREVLRRNRVSEEV